MNLLDIILTIIYAYFLYIGIKNGLIKELTNLLVIILGIYISSSFSYFTHDMIKPWFDWNLTALTITSYVLTFVVIALVINLVGILVTKVVTYISLGFVNRFFGALFGVAKITFILCLLLSIFAKINTNYRFVSKQNLHNSFVYSTLDYLNTQFLPIETIFNHQYVKDNISIDKV